MRDYVVFSLQIAHKLTRKGFEVKKSRININNPKYMVYYFEDTPELRAAIDEIYKTNKIDSNI